MKTGNDIKNDLGNVFLKYMNEMKDEYNVDDKDIHKIRQNLMECLDDVIVIEKK